MNVSTHTLSRAARHATLGNVIWTLAVLPILPGALLLIGLGALANRLVGRRGEPPMPMAPATKIERRIAA